MDLSRENVRVFGAGIACGPKNDCFTESSGQKLRKEGPAFLSAGDSSEPILFGCLILSRKRSGKDQLSGIDRSTWPNDTREFGEDLCS